jgi:hypothetical protein
VRKFFGYVWKGLDGLRKTLHLLFLSRSSASSSAA